MNRAARTLTGALLAAGLSLGVAVVELAIGSVPSVARAAGDWKKEFDAVCSKTQDAMALSSEELASLVSRCDELKAELDALDEATRKVYSRRLKACRDLYQFVLEHRQQGPG